MNYIEACNVLGVSENETFENISAKYYMLISKYTNENVVDLFYNEEACLIIKAYYCIKRINFKNDKNVKSR